MIKIDTTKNFRSDIDFIKKFGKITISGVCKKLKVNQGNLYNNKLSSEKENSQFKFNCFVQDCIDECIDLYSNIDTYKNKEPC